MASRPSELDTLLAASGKAADDLNGRSARIVYEGKVVAVAHDGDSATITVETPEGGRYVAQSQFVQLVAAPAATS